MFLYSLHPIPYTLTPMKVLMVGDVVGKPGREAVLGLVPRMRTAHRADFVIVNGENSAGGLGITRDIATAILDRAKVDVITLGNHAWAKKEVFGFLAEEPRILRPVNYPPGAPGRGYGIFRTFQRTSKVIAPHV